MLRFRMLASASAAYFYYRQSDAGLNLEDLRQEVGGEAAKLLGLATVPDFEQFKRLLMGLDPRTGEQLTAKLQRKRLAGWDVTASIPKGVTIAIEGGDECVREALWEAGRETMADLEKHIPTRMRGGRDGDKLTGNMIWYGFEHPETRPARCDNMPDCDRHIHFVIANLTWSGHQWQAIHMMPVWELRKWFDRRFDLRLASKLTQLGYEIETKYRGGKYYSWDIKGLAGVAAKFSRRTQEVEKLAEALEVRDPRAKDKLGATSRLHKRNDLTLGDLREYWSSRLSEGEKKTIRDVLRAAGTRGDARPENTLAKAAAYAIANEFYRRSLCPQSQLEIAVMERAMGVAEPEEVLAELKRQGVLLKGEEATTREVLEQEGRIIDFAREGKGTMRPLGDVPRRLDQAGTLSAEQQALIQHVMSETAQIVLVEGDAGTGKSTAIKPMFHAIHRPIEMLAPSAEASRGVLRREGFSRADTVASFLLNTERQAGVKNGVIWVDEVSLLPIGDLEALCGIAKAQNARLVLQGDPKQHRAVARDGNMQKVLSEFAGLPIGRLTEIWRQQDPRHKESVAAIAKGDFAKGYDILQGMGAVQQTEGHGKLVDDYLAYFSSSRSVLLVAPTHKAGDEITEAIRDRLRGEGKLGEEHLLETLKPLHWTDAQKAEKEHFGGDLVLQFHRNSGVHRAGERIAASDWLRSPSPGHPKHFSVYARQRIGVAAGDLVRITVNSRDKTGKHKLNNGSQYAVACVAPSGDITLSNGWVINTPHITHGHVSTSYGAQGRTVDVCLAAMNAESLPAINAEQFYVTSSRARYTFRLYTDLPPEELKAAIKKGDTRKSATEVFRPKRMRRVNPHIAMRKRMYEKSRRLLIEQQFGDVAKVKRSVAHER